MPPDRSSRQSTLKAFLDAEDAVGAFLGDRHRSSPSQESFQYLIKLGDATIDCLDLREEGRMPLPGVPLEQHARIPLIPEFLQQARAGSAAGKTRSS